MKVDELNGHEFHLPTSGGKAGKGRNRTSTIQVRRGGVIVKQYRFPMDNEEKRKKAIQRAKDFARGANHIES